MSKDTNSVQDPKSCMTLPDGFDLNDVRAAYHGLDEQTLGRLIGQMQSRPDVDQRAMLLLCNLATAKTQAPVDADLCDYYLNAAAFRLGEIGQKRALAFIDEGIGTQDDMVSGLALVALGLLIRRQITESHSTVEALQQIASLVQPEPPQE